MAERYLLDTDILVEYLRGSGQAAEYLEELGGELFVSAITIAELWAGVKGDEEEAALEQFLLAFQVVGIDDTLARQGGLLRRQYGPSHGTGLADALIAVSSIKSESTLVTFNAKHYPMVEQLQIPYER